MGVVLKPDAGAPPVTAVASCPICDLPELADAAAVSCNVERATCLQYLSGLDYAFTYKHLAGLTDFFRRLAQEGLVPDGSLSFISAA